MYSVPEDLREDVEHYKDKIEREKAQKKWCGLVSIFKTKVKHPSSYYYKNHPGNDYRVCNASKPV